MTPSPPVPNRARLVIAMVLGIVSAHMVLSQAGITPVPRDLVQFWFAARSLLGGTDPYAGIGPGLALDYPWPMVYPLPSVVAVLPLAGLTATWACAVFAGLAASCFAWAVMEFGYASLLAFLSICTWHAVYVVQWSPLLAASLVVPPLAMLLVVKPTIGAALFVARPSWWAPAGAAALLAIAFVLDPGWVGQWTNALQRATAMAKHGFPYRAPVLMPGGILVLLALSRWRRWEARLLVALACVPHTALPYEMVPLFLIPRGWRQCLLLVALSHGMWWLVTYDAPHPDFYVTVIHYTRTSVPLLYLPCLLMVLRRPNEGATPAWLEQQLSRALAVIRRDPSTRQATSPARAIE
jgi:hypothetical protein